jgi:hypothetical protein
MPTLFLNNSKKLQNAHTCRNKYWLNNTCSNISTVSMPLQFLSSSVTITVKLGRSRTCNIHVKWSKLLITCWRSAELAACSCCTCGYFGASCLPSKRDIYHTRRCHSPHHHPFDIGYAIIFSSYFASFEGPMDRTLKRDRVLQT